MFASIDPLSLPRISQRSGAAKQHLCHHPQRYASTLLAGWCGGTKPPRVVPKSRSIASKFSCARLGNLPLFYDFKRNGQETAYWLLELGSVDRFIQFIAVVTDKKQQQKGPLRVVVRRKAV